MKIGVFSTFMSPICSPSVIKSIAIAVEEAGLDSLWMGEHVVLFDSMEFGLFPLREMAKIPVPEGGGMLDTVATFGFFWQMRQRACDWARALPLYRSVIRCTQPKSSPCLDWLSEGRIDFGVGGGLVQRGSHLFRIQLA